MIKKIAAAAVVASLGIAASASADEDRVEHYEAKSAPNLEIALKNLHEYNKKLETHLNKEMTPKNMDQIHRLSYTLENALQRIDKDLGNIANALEGMHLASESMKEDAVVQNGDTYLKNLRMIIGEK